MSALPEFPPPVTNAGHWNEFNRRIDDGYRYDLAATAGAALCRSLLPEKSLAAARVTFGPGGRHHRPATAPQRPAPAPPAPAPAPPASTPQNGAYVPAPDEDIPLPPEPAHDDRRPEEWQ